MKTFEVEMLKIEKERNEMKKETLEIRKKEHPEMLKMAKTLVSIVVGLYPGRMPKDGSLSIGNEGEK